MRIVHVVESFAGGTLTAVAQLANHQAQAHQVTVIHSLRPESPAQPASLFDQAISLRHLPMPAGLAPMADFKAAGQLRHALKELPPEVVHLHSSKAGALGRLAAVGLGAQVLYTPHGFSFLRQDVSPKKQRLFLRLERALARLPGTIVACSQHEAQAAQALGHRAVACVPNAVSMENIVCSAACGKSVFPARTARSPLRIVIAGRITAARNPAGFTEVARRITALHPLVEFHWLGDGERHLLGPEIRVSGWLSPADLMASLRQADIYFHPSLWEGLPYAVLEAMALGLPVVASPVGGNTEAVSAQVTGYLADTVDAQVAALRALITNPTQRRQFGTRGANRVRTNYSLQSYLRAMDHLYTTGT